MTLVGRKDLEPNTLGELIEYIKANGDNVTYGNAGLGAASHLCGMLFMSAIDVQMTTIPYKGTGPAMTDLLGGQIDTMCDQTTNTTSQIQAGTVKAYGVTTKERIAALPDLPTAAEGGLAGFEVSVWHGLYAPKGTPKEVVDRLGAALRVALADPKVVEQFAELGTTPVAADRATPEALAETLKGEIEKWRPIIQAAGVYAD
jgi:tripartite-type tricarboxylate transporter receptor subunit TctC